MINLTINNVYPRPDILCTNEANRKGKNKSRNPLIQTISTVLMKLSI